MSQKLGKLHYPPNFFGWCAYDWIDEGEVTKSAIQTIARERETKIFYLA